MPHTQNTRERIIMVAAQVFYRHGYRATGVEAVAKAAGITRATLYHHFRDKDDLIEECLKFLSRFHRENYMKAWNRKGLTPQKKLTVLFDAMQKAFTEEDFFGCPFINASGEYTERGGTGHRGACSLPIDKDISTNGSPCSSTPCQRGQGIGTTSAKGTSRAAPRPAQIAASAGNATSKGAAARR